ncbi:hypothetical protein GE061_019750 [Apolygus lucorum]|uniref:Uncharacterized protein n=1 Tax=Apolygus lucorum TaxID=248454 RepID=A0A6A4JY04_APOLU|nr:hypothetical protein GE061_019750 [Apolygus lucorum]
MCFLSSAVGDISEKLKQGQGFSAPSQVDFQGLLAPFQDGQRTNVKGGRPSGVKGGRPSGVKGGGDSRQLGAGAALPAQRVPIPFRNHDGDDDEDNLDRLCNDAFHSFLCKPVGPRRRIDGNIRPGAKIPSGVLTGSSSNQISKQVPSLSGGALLPTESDNDEGYQYPKPTNNVPSIAAPGYSYPKPPYNYEPPKNPLPYPSQVSETVQKPSNEYLPSFIPSTPAPTTISPYPTTTYRPPTSPPQNNFGDFNAPSNQIPAQTNPEPVVLNELFYQYPKPSNPISLPAASQSFPIINQPTTYMFPQTTFLTTQTIPFVTSTTNPAVNLFTYSTAKPYNPFFIPSEPQPQFTYSSFPSSNELSTLSEAQPSNNEGYLYPKPSNDNPIILPTPRPELPPNNGYLPPVGAPVPKESNIIFNSLPPLPPVSSFPSSAATFSQSVPTSRYTTPFPFTFPSVSTTPRPIVTPATFRTTTYRPITVISTTPSTTIRPYTFPTTTTPLPPSSPSTLRPFIFQTTQSPTTSRPPIQFNFASSNDVPFSAPQPRKPTNGYLPPPSQPIPSPANQFQNVLPFSQPPSTPRPTLPPQTTPRPTLPPQTTPRPTLPPPPSKEYLPQVEGASSNVSPNFEGGSILAGEADAPTPDIKPASTERTHTLEELCRDAFHSFLCKPIDKPRRRIDGRLRQGARVPPHVMSLLAAAASSPVNRRTRPNLAGDALLPTQQNPQINQYQFQQPFQSTNVNPQLTVVPKQRQQSLFVLSESDSSSLAKKFRRPENTKSPLAGSSSNTVEKTVHKKKSKPIVPSVATNTQQRTSNPTTTQITTIRPTTFPSTTANPVFTTANSVPVSSTLQSASTVNLEKSLPVSTSGSGGQLLASSATDQGYRYPKPPQPLNYPNGSDTSNGYKYAKPSNPLVYPSTTSASGYDYPKPKTPFVFPTTQKPKARPTPPNRQFGQRLRPVQRTRKPAVGEERRLSQAQQELQQQQQEQEQQSQFQEDPFGQNEVIDRENGLPPASQFEILKP